MVTLTRNGRKCCAVFGQSPSGRSHKCRRFRAVFAPTIGAPDRPFVPTPGRKITFGPYRRWLKPADALQLVLDNGHEVPVLITAD
jgi:hypothetical protein